MLQPRLEVRVVPQMLDGVNRDGDSPHRRLQQDPEPAAVKAAVSAVPGLVEMAATPPTTWPPGCPPVVWLNNGGRHPSIEMRPNHECNRNDGLIPFRQGLLEQLREQKETATWCALVPDPNYKPGRRETWWRASPEVCSHRTPRCLCVPVIPPRWLGLFE